MKTKIHVFLLLAFIFFMAASGQNKVSQGTHDLLKSGRINPPSGIVSDPGKMILQPELGRLLDSVYQDNWDGSNWTLKTIDHKYRNPNGYLTEDLYVTKNPVSGTWNNYAHFLYTYNGTDADYITMTGEVWTDASTWMPYSYSHQVSRNFFDTTITKDWNSVKQHFTGGTKVINRFDAVDSTTDKLTQAFDTANSTWINQYKDSITYNAQHLQSEELFQSWHYSTSVWVNINKKVETYDTSNFLTGHMEYVWNDTANSWLSTLRITYVNDAAGNHLSSLTETWDPVLQVWSTYGQSIFNYNLMGWKLSERQQLYNQVTSTFDDSYLIYYTYYTSGLLQSTTGNYWKPNTTEWITDSYYLVDSNNFLSETYVKYHDNSTFELTGGDRTVYTYNGKYQLVNITKQVWSTASNDWLNSLATDYTYNVYKLLETAIDEEWGVNGNVWKNLNRSTYFYSEPFGINEVSNPDLCHFANPMRSGAAINCPGFTYGAPYRLNLYSLSGVLVYSVRFTGGSSISISPSVSEGLYLMQFTDGSGKILSNSKVMILK